MHDDLLVHDVHRVLGPRSTEWVPTLDADALRADLRDLGVSGCSAVWSWQLDGDPAGPGGASPDALAPVDASQDDSAPTIGIVPVVVPAAPGGGWPDDPGVLVDAGVRMVRACPERHRWSLDSRLARQWWDVLAQAGCAVSLDVAEVGFGAVHALAAAVPHLTVVALGPGYRELRRAAELLDARENVVLETGTLNTAGGLEWLAGVAGTERLVFGTGGPIVDDAGATWLLRHLDLPRADVDRSAHGTARDLLGVAP